LAFIYIIHYIYIIYNKNQELLYNIQYFGFLLYFAKDFYKIQKVYKFLKSKNKNFQENHFEAFRTFFSLNTTLIKIKNYYTIFNILDFYYILPRIFYKIQKVYFRKPFLKLSNLFFS